MNNKIHEKAAVVNASIFSNTLYDLTRRPGYADNFCLIDSV